MEGVSSHHLEELGLKVRNGTSLDELERMQLAFLPLMSMNKSRQLEIERAALSRKFFQLLMKWDIKDCTCLSKVKQ